MDGSSFRKYAAVALSTLMLAIQPQPALADRGEDLQNQLYYSQRKIQRAESAIDRADADRAEAARAIGEIDRRTFSLVNEIQALKAELIGKISEKERAEAESMALGREIEKNERDLGEAKARLAKRKRTLGLRFRWIYINGSMPYVAALLGSTSTADFLNRLSFLRMIAHRDSELVRLVLEEKAAIEKKRARLEEGKRSAEAKRSAAAAAARRIEEIKAEQEHQLATLRAEKADKEALIEKLRDDKAALQAVMQIERANAEVIQEQLRQWNASRIQRSPETSRGQDRLTPGGSAGASEPGWVWAPGAFDESVLAEVRRAIEAECARQGLNPGPVLEIVMRESGGNPWAVNLQSGAAGLFQRVPGSLVTLGDIAGQVRDGVAYIRETYGTSEAALAFWNAHGWY